MSKRPTEKPTKFADNLERLLGLHGLTSRQCSELVDVSESVLSKWHSGDRSPSFRSALLIADFFGVPADRLARANFEDLLAHELANLERFREVEAEIRRRRSTLKSVDARPSPPGKLKTARKVAAMDEARIAQKLRREGRSEEEIAEELERWADEPSTPEQGG